MAEVNKTRKEVVLEMAHKAKEFLTLEDGYYYYFPTKGGALSEGDLLIICEELKRLNEEVSKHFNSVCQRVENSSLSSPNEEGGN